MWPCCRVRGHEISEMTVLLLADWRFKRNGFLSDFYNFTNLFFTDAHFFRNFIGTGLSAEFLKQLPVNANELVDGFNHVHRNPYSARLIRNCARYRLADPPCCIC